MNTAEAKSILKKYLVAFKTLSKSGAFEAADELITMLDSAEHAAQDANKEVVKLKAEIEGLNSEKKLLVQTQKEAIDKANEIIEAAVDKGNAIVAHAEETAKSIASESDRALMARQAQVRNEEDKLKKLMAESYAAKEESDAINLALESAKTKLKNLLS